MSRPTIAVFSGLLSATLGMHSAWGQAPPRRPTFTERISAFGRGLTGNTDEQQQATPAAAAAEQPATRTAFPQVDGKSLLPNNMFGRSPQPQPNQNQQRTATERAGTGSRAASTSIPPRTSPTASPNATARSTSPTAAAGSAFEPAERFASRPRSGSTGEAIATQPGGSSLPGLGGSPLPQSFSSGNDESADDAASSITPQAGSNANSQAGGRATPRQSPRATPTTSSAARQSPRAHAPIQVNPSELRHELAGSFPTGDTNSDVTKPANDLAAQTLPVESSSSASTSNEQSFSTPAGEPVFEPSKQDSVYSLPANDGQDPAVRAQTALPEVTPIPRNTPAPRVDSTPSTSPTFESIPRTGPTSAFAPPATRQPVASAIPTQPVAPQASPRASSTAASRSALAEPNVLVANRTPIITSDIRGPKQIMVGREATFRVRLQNQGDAPAEGVDVALRVPSWADVIDTSPSNGSVTQSPSSESANVLRWQIARLEPRGSETIDLKLVPRSSRPLELGVTWTLAPVGSRAVVEVQEPKLEMNVAGPDEVLFGKPQLYRFTLSNPGSGLAENVRIELYPPGGSEKAAASNALADLPPGKSQTIEVELVAREAGKLRIKAVASAAGDLSSEAIKEVFCRKPELAVDWRGPEMKYAGTEATYFIRVRNPGTAPAEDVTVRATLPDGAQLASASEGQSYDAARREIAWRVGSLGPGDDSYMEVKCTVSTPGTNQLRLEATNAAGDLVDKKVAETKVVALGDLKLDVTDPSGPVAIGDVAVYEIRVQNRGASAAKDINIVGLFSAGVEPDQVDGTQYTVSNGRVSFRAIEELPAGRQVTLKIRAHAIQPGTHVFRAEVLCRDLEIKLAAEETTRFYADDSRDPAERQATGSNGFQTISR